MFYMSLAQLVLYEFGTVMEFQKERLVFVREKTSKLYGTNVYYLSKIIVELPLLLFIPLIETSIAYHGVGYRKGAFFGIYCINILSVQVGSGLGYLFSSLFNDLLTACTVTAFFTLPMVLLGGVLCNLKTLNQYLSWTQYFSPLRFSFEALLWV